MLWAFVSYILLLYVFDIIVSQIRSSRHVSKIERNYKDFTQFRPLAVDPEFEEEGIAQY